MFYSQHSYWIYIKKTLFLDFYATHFLRTWPVSHYLRKVCFSKFKIYMFAFQKVLFWYLNYDIFIVHVLHKLVCLSETFNPRVWVVSLPKGERRYVPDLGTNNHPHPSSGSLKRWIYLVRKLRSSLSKQTPERLAQQSNICCLHRISKTSLQ